MGDSLNPSPIHRLTEMLRPDWTRTLLARRIVAGGLVVLAAVAALRPDPDDQRVAAVVATRDLSPGSELTADDVRLETFSAATLPDGAQSDVTAVVGATLAGPVRRGEALTDVRLLTPRLAEAAVGPTARIVPLSLDETAVLDLIRPGDVVDVLAAGFESDAQPRVVATDAIVVLVSDKPTAMGGGTDRVVLVALPAHAANEVAAATLVQTVTLTLH
ncbi:MULTISPECIES: SAF domain-containing protein [Mycolicibacterium]|uniref:Flagella basal body P-ring formation protein FlgA n=2 Tax=Mycolicibacterium TaxID=1866885 RepID=A0AAW5SDE6_MYCNV|nr:MULTISPECIES: SAF domain-containing protein [Mycolicibacterium]MCV7022016.1 flagella basal body P-ring formation protein FlgA [Mycolicibacterium novocastrense]MCV7057082.1 flagella basal body P-ring formation protein FlgA [Mycolicibacterium gilvum]GAT08352.1 flagellar basal body P-ring biosynthesis protein [Mycolicibacterium novocastrense]STZ42592.1 flagellar basal body P-ring biosynthesis protein [Mycolicibacterium gilvum]